MKWLSDLLDWASEFFAHRKGLLPLIGSGLILINLVMQFIPGLGWLADSNLLLHLGALVAIIGFLLAFAL
ncbi:MAG: hypothetical protein WHV44_15055 [Anaerolineales bacterium]